MSARVLVLGRHPDLLRRAVATLRAEGYAADGAGSVEAALTALPAGYDAVTIGGGVGDDDRRAVHRAAAALPAPPVVVDVHGPDTLSARLAAALATRR